MELQIQEYCKVCHCTKTLTVLSYNRDDRDVVLVCACKDHHRKTHTVQIRIGWTTWLAEKAKQEVA